MRRISLLVAMICVMALPVAKAGVLLEPFVGYGFMTGQSSLSADGPLFGGRLGYKQMGLFGALEYSKVDLSGDITIGPLEVSYGFDGYLMTALAGYEFPTLLRVWGGYVFTGEADGASGFAVGVGFKPFPTPIPMMDLYINGEFKLVSVDALSDDLKIFAITVSIPFDI